VEISDSSSRILAGLLEARTGQQLTLSRRWRLETALSALLRERGIASIDELITILVMGREPGLAGRVVEALLNNETYFFRDRAPFDLLAKSALPALAIRRARERRLRIWSAGCSTGQEAYSLAMLFAEEPARWAGWQIDIVGTDVSDSAVDRARLGNYTQFEVQRGLAITQMIRWFAEVPVGSAPGGGGWQAHETLRRMVRFSNHNLLEAPPRPGQFDLILCRNVLLYLAPDTKTRAFDRLAEAMAPDGWLMLGAGETVIGGTRRLESDAANRGLYRHAETQVVRRSA
jgi:chemotaxis protein methyltransferase CheR